MVPTRIGKSGKNGREFSSEEKSQGIFLRLEKLGHLTQNTEKI